MNSLSKSHIHSHKCYSEKAIIEALYNFFGIIEFDIHGKILNLNENATQIFGYSKNEMIDQYHSKFFKINGSKIIHNTWDEIINGKINNVEYRTVNKLGNEIWISSSYTKIKDKNNDLIGVVSLIQNVTKTINDAIYNKSRIDAICKSQCVIEFNLDGIISSVNKNYCDLSGYNKSQLIGKHHSMLCLKEFSNSPEYNLFWSKLKSGCFISDKFERIGNNGKIFWIQAAYNPIYSSDGQLYKITKYAYDITKSVENEKSLKIQNELSNIIVNAQHSFLLKKDLTYACDEILEPILRLTECEFGFIGIIQKDNEDIRLYVPTITNLSWNDEMINWYDSQKKINNGLLFSNLDNLFGCVIKADVIVCTNDPKSHPASRGTPFGHPIIRSFLGIPIHSNNKISGMIAIANRKNGFNQYIIDYLKPLATTLGTLIHARILEDERNIIENSLRFNAEHDFLTGLPNRNSFSKNAEKIFKSFNFSSHSINNNCLAMIDIDHFKKINDKYGHLAGDSILKQFSELLNSQFRDIDIFARVGGEEFIVLLKSTNISLAKNIIDRCREIVEKHVFTFEDKFINLTFSAGIAQYSTNFKNIDEWAHAADCKLYDSKNNGRNKVT